MGRRIAQGVGCGPPVCAAARDAVTLRISTADRLLQVLRWTLAVAGAVVALWTGSALLASPAAHAATAVPAAVALVGAKKGGGNTSTAGGKTKKNDKKKNDKKKTKKQAADHKKKPAAKKPEKKKANDKGSAPKKAGNKKKSGDKPRQNQKKAKGETKRKGETKGKDKVKPATRPATTPKADEDDGDAAEANELLRARIAVTNSSAARKKAERQYAAGTITEAARDRAIRKDKAALAGLAAERRGVDTDDVALVDQVVTGHNAVERWSGRLASEKKKVAAGTLAATTYQAHVARYRDLRAEVAEQTDELMDVTDHDPGAPSGDDLDGAGATGGCARDGAFVSCSTAAQDAKGTSKDAQWVALAGVTRNFAVSSRVGAAQARAFCDLAGADKGCGSSASRSTAGNVLSAQAKGTCADCDMKFAVAVADEATAELDVDCATTGCLGTASAWTSGKVQGRSSRGSTTCVAQGAGGACDARTGTAIDERGHVVSTVSATGDCADAGTRCSVTTSSRAAARNMAVAKHWRSAGTTTVCIVTGGDCGGESTAAASSAPDHTPAGNRPGASATATATTYLNCGVDCHGEVRSSSSARNGGAPETSSTRSSCTAGTGCELRTVSTASTNPGAATRLSADSVINRKRLGTGPSAASAAGGLVICDGDGRCSGIVRSFADGVNLGVSDVARGSYAVGSCTNVTGGPCQAVTNAGSSSDPNANVITPIMTQRSTANADVTEGTTEEQPAGQTPPHVPLGTKAPGSSANSGGVTVHGASSWSMSDATLDCAGESRCAGAAFSRAWSTDGPSAGNGAGSARGPPATASDTATCSTGTARCVAQTSANSGSGQVVADMITERKAKISRGTVTLAESTGSAACDGPHCTATTTANTSGSGTAPVTARCVTGATGCTVASSADARQLTHVQRVRSGKHARPAQVVTTTGTTSGEVSCPDATCRGRITGDAHIAKGTGNHARARGFVACTGTCTARMTSATSFTRTTTENARSAATTRQGAADLAIACAATVCTGTVTGRGRGQWGAPGHRSVSVDRGGAHCGRATTCTAGLSTTFTSEHGWARDQGKRQFHRSSAASATARCTDCLSYTAGRSWVSGDDDGRVRGRSSATCRSRTGCASATTAHSTRGAVQVGAQCAGTGCRTHLRGAALAATDTTRHRARAVAHCRAGRNGACAIGGQVAATHESAQAGVSCTRNKGARCRHSYSASSDAGSSSSGNWAHASCGDRGRAGRGNCGTSAQLTYRAGTISAAAGCDGSPGSHCHYSYGAGRTARSGGAYGTASGSGSGSYGSGWVTVVAVAASGPGWAQATAACQGSAGTHCSRYAEVTAAADDYHPSGSWAEAYAHGSAGGGMGSTSIAVTVFAQAGDGTAAAGATCTGAANCAAPAVAHAVDHDKIVREEGTYTANQWSTCTVDNGSCSAWAAADAGVPSGGAAGCSAGSACSTGGGRQFFPAPKPKPVPVPPGSDDRPGADGGGTGESGAEARPGPEGGEVPLVTLTVKPEGAAEPTTRTCPIPCQLTVDGVTAGNDSRPRTPEKDNPDGGYYVSVPVTGEKGKKHEARGTEGAKVTQNAQGDATFTVAGPGGYLRDGRSGNAITYSRSREAAALLKTATSQTRSGAPFQATCRKGCTWTAPNGEKLVAGNHAAIKAPTVRLPSQIRFDNAGTYTNRFGDIVHADGTDGTGWTSITGRGQNGAPGAYSIHGTTGFIQLTAPGHEPVRQHVGRYRIELTGGDLTSTKTRIEATTPDGAGKGGSLYCDGDCRRVLPGTATKTFKPVTTCRNCVIEEQLATGVGARPAGWGSVTLRDDSNGRVSRYTPQGDRQSCVAGAKGSCAFTQDNRSAAGTGGGAVCEASGRGGNCDGRNAFGDRISATVAVDKDGKVVLDPRTGRPATARTGLLYRSTIGDEHAGYFCRTGSGNEGCSTTGRVEYREKWYSPDSPYPMDGVPVEYLGWQPEQDSTEYTTYCVGGGAYCPSGNFAPEITAPPATDDVQVWAADRSVTVSESTAAGLATLLEDRYDAGSQRPLTAAEYAELKDSGDEPLLAAYQADMAPVSRGTRDGAALGWLENTVAAANFAHRYRPLEPGIDDVNGRTEQGLAGDRFFTPAEQQAVEAAVDRLNATMPAAERDALARDWTNAEGTIALMRAFGFGVEDYQAAANAAVAKDRALIEALLGDAYDPATAPTAAQQQAASDAVSARQRTADQEYRAYAEAAPSLLADAKAYETAVAEVNARGGATPEEKAGLDRTLAGLQSRQQTLNGHLGVFQGAMRWLRGVGDLAYIDAAGNPGWSAEAHDMNARYQRTNANHTALSGSDQKWQRDLATNTYATLDALTELAYNHVRDNAPEAPANYQPGRTELLPGQSLLGGMHALPSTLGNSHALIHKAAITLPTWDPDDTTGYRNDVRFGADEIRTIASSYSRDQRARYAMQGLTPELVQPRSERIASTEAAIRDAFGGGHDKDTNENVANVLGTIEDEGDGDLYVTYARVWTPATDSAAAGWTTMPLFYMESTGLAFERPDPALVTAAGGDWTPVAAPLAGASPDTRTVQKNYFIDMQGGGPYRDRARFIDDSGLLPDDAVVVMPARMGTKAKGSDELVVVNGGHTSGWEHAEPWVVGGAAAVGGVLLAIPSGGTSAVAGGAVIAGYVVTGGVLAYTTGAALHRIDKRASLHQSNDWSNPAARADYLSLGANVLVGAGLVTSRLAYTAALARETAAAGGTGVRSAVPGAGARALGSVPAARQAAQIARMSSIATFRNFATASPMARTAFVANTSGLGAFGYMFGEQVVSFAANEDTMTPAQKSTAVSGLWAGGLMMAVPGGVLAGAHVAPKIAQSRFGQRLGSHSWNPLRTRDEAMVPLGNGPGINGQGIAAQTVQAAPEVQAQPAPAEPAAAATRAERARAGDRRVGAWVDARVADRAPSTRDPAALARELDIPTWQAREAIAHVDVQRAVRVAGSGGGKPRSVEQIVAATGVSRFTAKGARSTVTMDRFRADLADHLVPAGNRSSVAELQRDYHLSDTDARTAYRTLGLELLRADLERIAADAPVGVEALAARYDLTVRDVRDMHTEVGRARMKDAVEDLVEGPVERPYTADDLLERFPGITAKDAKVTAERINLERESRAVAAHADEANTAPDATAIMDELAGTAALRDRHGDDLELLVTLLEDSPGAGRAVERVLRGDTTPDAAALAGELGTDSGTAAAILRLATSEELAAVGGRARLAWRVNGIRWAAELPAEVTVAALRATFGVSKPVARAAKAAVDEVSGLRTAAEQPAATHGRYQIAMQIAQNRVEAAFAAALRRFDRETARASQERRAALNAAATPEERATANARHDDAVSGAERRRDGELNLAFREYGRAVEAAAAQHHRPAQTPAGKGDSAQAPSPSADLPGATPAKPAGKDHAGRTSGVDPPWYERLATSLHDKAAAILRTAARKYGRFHHRREIARERLLTQRTEKVMADVRSRLDALKAEFDELVGGYEVGENGFRVIPEDALPGLMSHTAKRYTDLLDRVARGGDRVHRDVLDEAIALHFEAIRRENYVRGKAFGWRDGQMEATVRAALSDRVVVGLVTSGGKTEAAMMAVWWAALKHDSGIHVVTSTDALAARDHAYYARVAEWLGQKDQVGLLASERAAPAPEGVTYGSPLMKGAPRGAQTPQQQREALSRRITVGTVSELAFIMLRDRLVRAGERPVMGRQEAIFGDEIDALAIEEARSAFIISEPIAGAPTATAEIKAYAVAQTLTLDTHFTFAGRRAVLTRRGRAEPGVAGRGPEVENALTAAHLYREGPDYVLVDGEVLLVDANTGRVLPGRRLQDGLHEAIEAKELAKRRAGVVIKQRNRTLAALSLPELLAAYPIRIGLTGTTQGTAKVFRSVYKMRITTVEAASRLRRESHYFVGAAEKTAAMLRYVADTHAKGAPIVIETALGKGSHIHGLVRALARAGRFGEEALLLRPQDSAAHEAFVLANAGRPGAVTVVDGPRLSRGVNIKLGGDAEFLPAGVVRPGDAELVRNWDGVDEGGLVVIRTERPEERIAHQIDARAARGDEPGRAVEFLDLDDPILGRVPGKTRKLRSAYGTDELRHLEIDVAADPRVAKLFSAAVKKKEKANVTQLRAVVRNPANSATTDGAVTAATPRALLESARDQQLRLLSEQVQARSGSVATARDVLEVAEADARAGKAVDVAAAAGEFLTAKAELDTALAGFRALGTAAVRAPGAAYAQPAWQYRRGEQDAAALGVSAAAAGTAAARLAAGDLGGAVAALTALSGSVGSATVDGARWAGAEQAGHTAERALTLVQRMAALRAAAAPVSTAFEQVQAAAALTVLRGLLAGLPAHATALPYRAPADVASIRATEADMWAAQPEVALRKAVEDVDAAPEKLEAAVAEYAEAVRQAPDDADADALAAQAETVSAAQEAADAARSDRATALTPAVRRAATGYARLTDERIAEITGLTAEQVEDILTIEVEPGWFARQRARLLRGHRLRVAVDVFEEGVAVATASMRAARRAFNTAVRDGSPTDVLLAQYRQAGEDLAAAADRPVALASAVRVARQSGMPVGKIAAITGIGEDRVGAILGDATIADLPSWTRRYGPSAGIGGLVAGALLVMFGAAGGGPLAGVLSGTVPPLAVAAGLAAIVVVVLVLRYRVTVRNRGPPVTSASLSTAADVATARQARFAEIGGLHRDAFTDEQLPLRGGALDMAGGEVGSLLAGLAAAATLLDRFETAGDRQAHSGVLRLARANLAELDRHIATARKAGRTARWRGGTAKAHNWTYLVLSGIGIGTSIYFMYSMGIFAGAAVFEHVSEWMIAVGTVGQLLGAIFGGPLWNRLSGRTAATGTLLLGVVPLAWMATVAALGLTGPLVIAATFAAAVVAGIATSGNFPWLNKVGGWIDLADGRPGRPPMPAFHLREGRAAGLQMVGIVVTLAVLLNISEPLMATSMALAAGVPALFAVLVAGGLWLTTPPDRWWAADATQQVRQSKALRVTLGSAFALLLVAAYATYGFGLAVPDAVWRDYYRAVDAGSLVTLGTGFSYVFGGLIAWGFLEWGDHAAKKERERAAAAGVELGEVESGPLKTMPGRLALFFAALMVAGSVILLAGQSPMATMFGLWLLEASTTGMLLALGGVARNASPLSGTQLTAAMLVAAMVKALFYMAGALSSAGVYSTGGWLLVTLVGTVAAAATLTLVLFISAASAAARAAKSGSGSLSYRPGSGHQVTGAEKRATHRHLTAHETDFDLIGTAEEILGVEDTQRHTDVRVFDAVPGVPDVFAYTWRRSGAMAVIFVRRDVVQAGLLRDVLDYEYTFRVHGINEHRLTGRFNNLSDLERIQAATAVLARLHAAGVPFAALPADGVVALPFSRPVRRSIRAAIAGAGTKQGPPVPDVTTAAQLRELLAEHEARVAAIPRDRFTHDQEPALDGVLRHGRAILVLAERPELAGLGEQALVRRFVVGPEGERSRHHELLMHQKAALEAGKGARHRGGLAAGARWAITVVISAALGTQLFAMHAMTQYGITAPIGAAMDAHGWVLPLVGLLPGIGTTTLFTMATLGQVAGMYLLGPLWDRFSTRTMVVVSVLGVALAVLAPAVIAAALPATAAVPLYYAAAFVAGMLGSSNYQLVGKSDKWVERTTAQRRQFPRKMLLGLMTQGVIAAGFFGVVSGLMVLIERLAGATPILVTGLVPAVLITAVAVAAWFVIPAERWDAGPAPTWGEMFLTTWKTAWNNRVSRAMLGIFAYGLGLGAIDAAWRMFFATADGPAGVGTAGIWSWALGGLLILAALAPADWKRFRNRPTGAGSNPAKTAVFFAGVAAAGAGIASFTQHLIGDPFLGAVLAVWLMEMGTTGLFFWMFKVLPSAGLTVEEIRATTNVGGQIKAITYVLGAYVGSSSFQMGGWDVTTVLLVGFTGVIVYLARNVVSAIDATTRPGPIGRAGWSLATDSGNGYELVGERNEAYAAAVGRKLDAGPDVRREVGGYAYRLLGPDRRFHRRNADVPAYTLDHRGERVVVLRPETLDELERLREHGLPADFLERVLAYEYEFRVHGAPEKEGARIASARALVTELNAARDRQRGAHRARPLTHLAGSAVEKSRSAGSVGSNETGSLALAVASGAFAAQVAGTLPAIAIGVAVLGAGVLVRGSPAPHVADPTYLLNTGGLPWERRRT